jgi:hypothetical protein
MRLQSAMSAAFSHSYLKVARALKDEIAEGLPEEGAIFSKTDLLNNISGKKVRSILESERPRSELKELMRSAYTKAKSKRNFSEIKSEFEYLYDRLGYFKDFLTSNMSSLNVVPRNKAFDTNIVEDIEYMLGLVKKTGNKRKVYEETNLNNTSDKEYRIKRPSFRPKREVENEEKLINLFSNILREGIWRELLMNALDALAAGDPDLAHTEVEFYCEPSQLIFENWADNAVDGTNWQESEISKPRGERGFGLYGVRVIATDVLQIADSVRYFERSNRSRVEISMRPGWIVSDG